ncbi:unnamed protein product [Nippostrongylus brasiliensis]|uniref:Type II toxin-antitoxin system HicA family toxin n=1 Tax=Nippostrongylus brasiliensis TaxID=27835 RepID=A0A0N4XHK3_NIPBR|nr:unnamed protein product [Nippostrongylus brasiliensis]
MNTSSALEKRMSVRRALHLAWEFSGYSIRHAKTQRSRLYLAELSSDQPDELSVCQTDNSSGLRKVRFVQRQLGLK